MVIVSQEGGLKLTFQKQGFAQKRPSDNEDCSLGQQQHPPRLRELQGASETSLTSVPKSTPASGEYAGVIAALAWSISYHFHSLFYLLL